MFLFSLNKYKPSSQHREHEVKDDLVVGAIPIRMLEISIFIEKLTC